MIERATFPINLRWQDGKTGLLVDPKNGVPDLQVASPPEFDGPGGLWSPEHLLVASVVSCFMTTFMAVAELSSLNVLDLDIEASGELARGEDRRYRFEHFDLTANIAVDSERAGERVPRLVEKAEAACLVTRSLSSPVHVRPRVSVRSEAELAVTTT
jgi:organic hydroperoxide reductase OsmC/OhrA